MRKNGPILQLFFLNIIRFSQCLLKLLLQEGVRKFSSTTNKNLPWRKILEFGRHIFDDTRTPVDLKDKWRSLLGR